MNIDGSGITQLGSDYCYFPTWYPLGSFIAFARPSHFRLMDENGNYIAQLLSSIVDGVYEMHLHLRRMGIELYFRAIYMEISIFTQQKCQ